MQDDKEINMSEFPEGLNKFQDNWTKKHPGRMPGYCHNVYQLITEDMDGNIVDEKYAVNCMTDYGFDKICNATDSYSFYLYAGNGEGEIDPASKTMISVLPGDRATETNSDIAFNGQRFYPEIGMTVCRYRIYSGYFNYTHWDEDKIITEIGLGNGSNNLWYHAKIYDIDGNETQLVKKVYQRLTINVYVKMLVPIAELCNKAWDKGCFLLMREYTFYKRRYYSDYGAYAFYLNWDSYYPIRDSRYSYPNNNYLYGYGGAGEREHVHDKVTGSFGAYLIESKYRYISDLQYSDENKVYNDSDRNRANAYWFALFKPKLETPIAIETDWFCTSSYGSTNFSSLLGGYPYDTYYSPTGTIPATDIDIKSLKMYSCQDHDYTIDVPFEQPEKSPKYDIGYLMYSIYDHNYIQHLDKEAWFRVWVNTAPDVPITGFNITGHTFYATDAYWDSSTWEVIPNVKNFPEHLRTKRYYCAILDSLDYGNNPIDTDYGSKYKTIQVYRDQKLHKIIPKMGAEYKYWNFGMYYHDLDYQQYGSSQYLCRCISNDEYGYIACLNSIFFPDSPDPDPQLGDDPAKTNADYYPRRYNIYGWDGYRASTSLIYNTTRGGHIVIFGYNDSYMRTGCRVYTIANAETEPTHQDFNFDQQYSNKPHYSHSDNGWMVVSYISGANNVNKTHVIRYDVEGDEGPTMYSVVGYHHAHAIDLTDYFCGVNGEVKDHLSLDIYDMKNQQVVDTIDIPEGYSFAGMAGWKNFIYIRVLLSGTYTTYVYYITERILTSTPLNLPQMAIDENAVATHGQLAVAANGNCQSCMVLPYTDDSTSYEHMLFKESDPLNPIKLVNYSDSSKNNNTYGAKRYAIPRASQLRYINDGQQLLLTIEGYDRLYVYDVGWILDHGPLPTCYQYRFCYSYDYYRDKTGPSPVLYKNSIGLMKPYRYYGEYNGNSYGHRQHFWLYPYENNMNLQLKATTRTINSFHNPVRIGSVKGFKFSITNRDVEPSTPATASTTEEETT